MADEPTPITAPTIPTVSNAPAATVPDAPEPTRVPPPEPRP
jgi:hypothetical protein